MRRHSWLIVPVALLCALVFGSIPALAQSTKVVELARFSLPLDVSVGIAAMPDGRVFTFGNGADGFGGINEAIPSGGGYQTVQVYVFTEAGEVPTNTCRNQVCTDAIAAGADGTVYFSGRYLSRFDPAAHTVTHLQDFGADNDGRALTLGNDGHTLFGARSDGRVFRFDTVGGTYQELTNVGGDVFGVLQMDNGTLIVTLNQWTVPAATLIQVDSVTGAWLNQFSRNPGWTANPAKGDDGKVYLFSWTFSGGQKFSPIDSTCFCGLATAIPTDRANTIMTIRNGFAYYNATGGVRRRNISTGAIEPVTSARVNSGMKMAPDGRLLIYVENNDFIGTWRSIDTNTLVPGVESSVLIAETSAIDGLDPPPLAVTEAANGKLYGISSYSLNPTATIFEIDPVTHAKSIAATFVHFEHPNINCCAVEFEPMVAAPNGDLYGLYTMFNSYLFRFSPATGAVSVIHKFDGDTDGKFANAMTLGRDGRLYGVLQYAGTAASFDGGGFFRLDPATDDVTTIFGSLGFHPSTTLTEGAAGHWYGSTWYSSSPGACTDVYDFDQTALTVTIVRSLTDQEACVSELAALPNGKLLGTTPWGGPPPEDPNQYSAGAVFTLDPATGAFTLLSSYASEDPRGYGYPGHPFAGADGYGYVGLAPLTSDNASALIRFDPQTGAQHLLFQSPGNGYNQLFRPGRSGRIYTGLYAPASILGIGVLDSISVAPSSGPNGGATSVSATLKTIGIPVPGRTITFTLNGQAIGSATTDANGVATVNNVSLAGIAIGSYPAAILTSFAGDDVFPASTGAGSLTVIDVPTPGLMYGDGFIRDDDMRYDFGFVVREKADGTDRGTFVLKIVDTDTPKHGRKKPTPRNDKFVSTSYTNVVFSDDPTIRPGRHHQPQVDTVLFSGPGTWNGAAGYRFEAFAQDCGEPGRRRESLRVTIYDSANHIVVQFDDELAGGNVQSIRIRH